MASMTKSSNGISEGQGLGLTPSIVGQVERQGFFP